MSGSDLFTGTLDLLILESVRDGALHGYAIGRRLREHSSGVLNIEEGALYPALHRLKGKGLLEADWGRTDTGRRAKFYAITKAGRSHLESESQRWRVYAGAVSAIIGSSDA